MQNVKCKSLLGTVLVIVIVSCIFAVFKSNKDHSIPAQTAAAPLMQEKTKPKVLFVDSYHKGYQWSEGILQGVLRVFNGNLLDTDSVDCSDSPVTLRVVRMDTKRNQSETFMSDAGSRVQQLIDAWKPVIVITSDDNAARYVIVPYYMNSDLPFVFCGINWDASGYGFPCTNVTGMVEVDLIDNMLTVMRQYARGSRLGLLGADNVSNRKAAENYVNKLGLTFTEKAFVSNLPEMENAYLDLQEKVDMLILMPPSFIDSESDAARARKFMLDNTTIVTGSVESWIAPYTLFCFGKSSEELGIWAASTAMQILDGTAVSAIPPTQNQQAVMHLNMPLANKLNILFPVEMIEQATIITDQ